MFDVCAVYLIQYFINYSLKSESTVFVYKIIRMTNKVLDTIVTFSQRKHINIAYYILLLILKFDFLLLTSNISLMDISSHSHQGNCPQILHAPKYYLQLTVTILFYFLLYICTKMFYIISTILHDYPQQLYKGRIRIQ